eukprot:TRINITY_DN24542_c0_g1_i1.p1 TRINITY_DN24542_c0_g1~~TRINITY_DN24542_c0_g1_i1.p1  ORF type:complete len:257 (-),score=58.21 TRINITY_DN24542_c0_g1_i1:72-842(-)
MDADVDIKFVVTTAAPEFKGNFRNPERGLIRHQLMEIIVRLADHKFYQKKGPGTETVAQTMAEAVDLILKESCQPVFSKYNQQEWRDTRYWNEECDDIYKFFKSMLEHIYLKYSVKKKKPGQKNFMCLEELYEICRKAELFDLNVVERDVFMAFNLSMMTQWDETTNDRIFQMSFVEYLEAIARLAEKCSPPLYYEKEEYTPEQRAQMPLHIKLEAILVILWKNVTDFEFKQTFQLPKTSLFAPKEEENESEEDEG